MLPGLGNRGGGREQGRCTDLPSCRVETPGAGEHLETGVGAAHGCDVCCAQICGTVGTGERGVGETGLDHSGRGSQGQHGALGAGSGVVVMEVEEDRLGLCLGGWGSEERQQERLPPFVRTLYVVWLSSSNH